jgi:hypothetical protein
VDQSTEEDNYDCIPGALNTDIVYEGNSRGHISGSFGQPDNAISNQRDKPFDLRYSKDFIKFKPVKLDSFLNDTPKEISKSEATSETSTTLQPCDKLLQQYLIDCIKFHQALIG